MWLPIPHTHKPGGPPRCCVLTNSHDVLKDPQTPLQACWDRVLKFPGVVVDKNAITIVGNSRAG